MVRDDYSADGTARRRALLDTMKGGGGAGEGGAATLSGGGPPPPGNGGYPIQARSGGPSTMPVGPQPGQPGIEPWMQPDYQGGPHIPELDMPNLGAPAPPYALPFR